MLRIRQGFPEDAALLSVLAQRSKASLGYDADFLEACRADLTYHEIDFPCFFFALAENPDLKGFYSLSFLTETETELDGLFVHPDAIGQGYGRALLTHAKIQSRVFGASSIIIVSDPNSVGFYKRLGAQPCGEKPSPCIPGRMLPVLSLMLD